MTRTGPVPQDEWETVVRNVPIVSVDLVVRHGEAVVLGKRENEPAKGEWFVPGGTVAKHERLEAAARRVAREELGVEVTIQERLGVYEHFWDEAEMEGVGGKHYVPTAFLVTTDGDDIRPDDQHASVRAFEPPFEEVELHPYVEAYLRDAGVPLDS